MSVCRLHGSEWTRADASLLALCFALALCSGCYGDHQGSPMRPDAGSDAGYDGDVGPLLPIEPEPDPMPDERPSGPWSDVPPPAPGSVVLVPVGEPVPLDDAIDTAGAPELVWNGDGWGVAWQGHFRVLDADGLPLTDAATTRDRSANIALDFAVGRYAIVVGAAYWGSAPMEVAALDRRGTLATEWVAGPAGDGPRGSAALGDGVDVGRLESAHQWVIGASNDASGAGSEMIVAFAADDSMQTVGDRFVLAEDGQGDVRVGGAKTRAVVAWPTSSGVLAQVFRGSPPTPDGAPFQVLSLYQGEDSKIEIEAYRDLVAIVAAGGGEVQIGLVDAWSRALVREPTHVPTHPLIDRRPGLAAASELGFFVACWGTGHGAGGASGGNDGVRLQMFGTDGTAWGEPLDLVTSELNIGGVDCGWSGNDVVVVWWRAGGDGGHNAIFSQRAHPTFL